MIYHRDQLSNVVCNIRIPKGGTNEEVGTAIFIAKGDDAFLLTAAHVINNITPQTYAVLSDSTGAPQKVLLSDLLGGATFIKHGQADLAKAKINITATNGQYVQGRCYPYDQIDISSNLLSKDVELTTIGFPMGLGATGAKFTPLTFRTFVAAPAITLPRFDNSTPCDFIILELPSTGGYSGGPLFDLGYLIVGAMTTTKEKTILHGIVHGTISDTTGGKLAAITPCKYLDGWL
jgi:S1-C subfamily serine protease